MAEEKERRLQGRVAWIDVAKGIGMLLVIIGHMLTKPIRFSSEIYFSLYTGVYFFHMPFMFYLSGRTFGMAEERYSQQVTFKVLGKKAWQLLVPYVVYDIIVYLVFTVANSIGSINAILENSGYGKQKISDFLYGMLIGDNEYAYHLWYIYALFFMTLISYLLMKYMKKIAPIALMIISVAMAFVRVSDTPFFINTTYWGAFNTIMKCYFWFVIGTYVDFSGFCKKWWSCLWQIFSVIYMILVATNFNGWAYSSGHLWFETMKWFADAGLLMLFVHFAVLCKGYLERFFSYTGKQSYGIYLFHQPFFASGCGLVLVKVLRLPIPLVLLVVLVACYVVPLGICKLLDMKYLQCIKPFLLGTPRKKRG